MIQYTHRLKFTPLEFETSKLEAERLNLRALKFTPLEFETVCAVANTGKKPG